MKIFLRQTRPDRDWWICYSYKSQDNLNIVTTRLLKPEVLEKAKLNAKQNAWFQWFASKFQEVPPSNKQVKS